jgi:hypothetical protein
MELKIFIDGKLLQTDKNSEILAAFADNTILQRKGGFLFKACVSNSLVQLGVLPSFSDGVRNMHYSIQLKHEAGCIFSGFVNTNTSLTIIPVPGKETRPEQNDRTPIADSFCKLLECLTEHGLDAETNLDPLSLTPFKGVKQDLKKTISICNAKILIKKLYFS